MSLFRTGQIPLLLVCFIAITSTGARAWQIPVDQVEFDLKKPGTMRIHYRQDRARPIAAPAPGAYNTTIELDLPPGIRSIPADLAFDGAGWQVRLKQKGPSPKATSSLNRLRKLVGKQGTAEVEGRETAIEGALSAVDRKNAIVENRVGDKLEASMFKTKELNKLTTRIADQPSSHKLVFIYSGNRPHAGLEVSFTIEFPEPVGISYRCDFLPNGQNSRFDIQFDIQNWSATQWDPTTQVSFLSGKESWAPVLQNPLPVRRKIQLQQSLPLALAQTLELETSPASQAITKTEWVLAGAREQPDMPTGATTVVRSNGRVAEGEFKIVDKKVEIRFPYDSMADQNDVIVDSKKATNEERLLAAKGVWLDVCNVYATENKINNDMRQELAVRFVTAKGNVLHVPGSGSSSRKQTIKVRAGKNRKASVLVSKEDATRQDARSLDSDQLEELEKKAISAPVRRVVKQLRLYIEELETLVDQRKNQVAVLTPTDSSKIPATRVVKVQNRKSSSLDEQYEILMQKLSELAADLPGHSVAKCSLP